jgi:hypothetical protein
MKRQAGGRGQTCSSPHEDGAATATCYVGILLLMLLTVILRYEKCRHTVCTMTYDTIFRIQRDNKKK